VVTSNFRLKEPTYWVALQVEILITLKAHVEMSLKWSSFFLHPPTMTKIIPGKGHCVPLLKAIESQVMPLVL
jgi:hypothetical protein